MMGHIDSEASVSYLTLSVFAQSMFERLVDPPADESNEEAQKALEAAIAVFQSIDSPKRRQAATVAGLRPFQKYGQVTTFYDILAESRDQVSTRLQALISFLEDFRDDPSEIDTDIRDEFADLFDKLATKALHRSRRPPQAIPPGVRQLCQQV